MRYTVTVDSNDRDTPQLCVDGNKVNTTLNRIFFDAVLESASKNKTVRVLLRDNRLGKITDTIEIRALK